MLPPSKYLTPAAGPADLGFRSFWRSYLTLVVFLKACRCVYIQQLLAGGAEVDLRPVDRRRDPVLFSYRSVVLRQSAGRLRRFQRSVEVPLCRRLSVPDQRSRRPTAAAHRRIQELKLEAHPSFCPTVHLPPSLPSFFLFLPPYISLICIL